jgi:putative oxygen-independent coproporphyrinogen III oxidase
VLELPPLSLYIHIPWCVRKCPYCDFNSHEPSEAIPERAYTEALLADLDSELHLAQGRALQSIFIGGGTPSLFSAASIKAILDGVKQRLALDRDIEITLEANPGTLEANRFKGYVEAGVNRISLGVQSFDEQCLRGLGRIHDARQALRAVEMARTAGLRSFNIDLMHGLPGQAPPTANTDLQTAIDSGAAHISWYQLTIEPNTQFYSQRPQLPPENLLASIQDAGEAKLSQAGLQAYEVSAFARDGFRCRHNLNYWQFGDYLGIGAGAHGKLTDLRVGQVLRTAKLRQPDGYLGRRNKLANQRLLSATDLAGEYMMNALRLHDGFDIDDFTRHTGLASAYLQDALADQEERGLLQCQGSRVKASALGRRFLDTLVAAFFE